MENSLNFGIETADFLTNLFEKYHFSFQEKKQISEFAIDFEAWCEKPIYEYFDENFVPNFCKFDEHSHAKEIFVNLRKIWQDLKQTKHNYANFTPNLTPKQNEISLFSSDKIALGRCPVASVNTRCCNLLTLDAVQSCGFDCSYCSIQSFYNGGKIGFNSEFAKNLKNLKLNPNQTYHIGTGQSSDSLMWGDKFGVLSALCEFARVNPNVILELKSKSDNIKFLLENEIPANIIATFSLNTPTIVENEEHFSANLNARLKAAKALSEKGILVGFHFHPMVWYENYQSEYTDIFAHLQSEFDPQNVACVSFGTLTFIKSVIKKLRERKRKSKILQMPLCEINGKFSYPHEIKKEMFKFAYESFAKWHGKVFFYMCMEEKSLWSECFGYEFSSNDEMERAMKKAYFEKIALKGAR